MNGRVYDPVLGRFLSADPYVEDAGDSQAFNRYSYVSNNPLGATDPSGYFKLSLKQIVVIVAVVVASVVTAGAAIAAWGVSAAGVAGSGFAAGLQAIGFSAGVINGIIGGAVGGFASGFAGSLLNGGSIGDAFKSGVIGGVAGAITGGIAGKIGDVFGDVSKGTFGNEFGRALAHGTVGGVAEEVQGGSFRHGFYAGFAGSAAGSVVGQTALQDMEGNTGVATRTAIVATAGGTASALGGGKFANGAVTAAFQHLFNAEAHRGFMGKVSRFFGGDPDGGFLGTNLTSKEFFGAAGDGAKRGAAAYADGFIPGWDPFESAGVYNHLDDGLYWSQAAGMIGFDAVATVSGTRVLAAAGNTRWGKVLNANRYIRVGDGRVGKDMVPRISIGNGKPSTWNHWWW